MKGSILIIISILTAFILLFGLTVMRNTFFLYKTLKEFEEYEQNFRFTEAVLNYGIEYCKNNFHKINRSKKLLLSMSNIPLQGRIKINRNSKGKFFLEAYTFYLKERLLFKISCFLKKGDNNFIIENWKINGL